MDLKIEAKVKFIFSSAVRDVDDSLRRGLRGVERRSFEKILLRRLGESKVRALMSLSVVRRG